NGERDWWLSQLDGRFVVAYFAGAQPVDHSLLARLRSLEQSPLSVKAVVILSPGATPNNEQSGITTIVDSEQLLASRYDARAGTSYLIRPDQHIAARWRRCEPHDIDDALKRASGSH